MLRVFCSLYGKDITCFVQGKDCKFTSGFVEYENQGHPM